MYHLDRESLLNTLLTGGGRVYVDLAFDDSTAETDLDVWFDPSQLWSRYGGHDCSNTYYAYLAAVSSLLRSAPGSAGSGDGGLACVHRSVELPGNRRQGGLR